jgi:hypothetical protein
VSQEGKLTVLTPGLKETVEKLGGITGLAAGPDGCVYAACPSAVLRIGPDGTASTLVHPVAVVNCDEDFPDGNVSVLENTNANGGAADGWTPRVRKLAPDGKVTTLATVPSRPKP